ncbi:MULTISPECIES: glycosyltransferase [unclassified Brevibacterium]|uniref:glycosyltransferase n=1 Tax=unclassified Brevibacterium TaxID=2614124 RepID=UPI001E4DDB6B|nr:MULTISPECIES: glycosyltransferase [unclassified Brevibacterium]MCD1287684.1 hypothetical protein [Brevibacterium sp. CCUG 69071]MDK8436597.1 glycosyltransferase [Brevibacterium sp. H-BE7]
MSIELSLVIPSFRGEEHIRPCLDSIVNQTLSPEKYEVLVVVNGSPDSVPEIVDEILSANSKINYQIIYEELPSLSNARNVGIQWANGDWVTWVDVDDWISNNFLEELLDCARDGVTPLACVADVDEVSGAVSPSPISKQILEHSPGEYKAATLWRALGFAACKLLPTTLAKQRAFDVELRSGEDVAYFPPFYAENELRFDNTPAHKGATYFRQVRTGSMSRQTASFDFSVSQRLRVMQHLDLAAVTAKDDMKSVMHGMMRSQTLFAKRFLDEHPDQLTSVIDAFDDSSLYYTPWNILSAKTNRLAISYNFLPFADASAVVAAKRIINSNRQWNVINNDMSKVRSIDTELHAAVLPYISTQKTIRNVPIFGGWRGVREFCESGRKEIANIEEAHGPQTDIYSRSMWPASHYLAASQKVKRPNAKWTAEFSDPLRKDVFGTERLGNIEDDELWREVYAAVDEAGFELSVNESLFAVCEKIAYALADEIYFTNSHQMKYMMSYLNDEALRSRVRRIARIVPQPVPGSRLLSNNRSEAISPETGRIEIGYFGSFYPNRGAGAILEALRSSGKEVREKVRLNIFTPNHENVSNEISRYDLNGSVLVADQLPYLEFLRKATAMDYLLISDAETASTGHRINPYLPSKLSDYLGTGSSIWALFEPGSILSRQNLTIMNRAGDLQQIASTLKRIAQ